MTNTELYERAIGVLNNHRESARSLRDWLAALAGILGEFDTRSDLVPENLLDALGRAFTADVAALDGIDRYQVWEPSTAAEVLGLLARQVDDLDAMERAGTLEGEWIYFGATAPSGEQWFNFDPTGFVELRHGGGVWRMYTGGAKPPGIGRRRRRNGDRGRRDRRGSRGRGSATGS